MGLLVLLFYKIKNFLDYANFYTKKPAKHFCLQVVQSLEKGIYNNVLCTHSMTFWVVQTL